MWRISQGGVCINIMGNAGVGHPPTLLVQSVTDYWNDYDAARWYHQTMMAHNATSTHFAVGGECGVANHDYRL